MPASYAELEHRYAELRDLSIAQSLAGWDQEVMMPRGGAEARAHTLAALAGVVHSRTTDRSLVRLVEGLHRRQRRLTPQRRRTVELARRTVLKATRIPEELARELALAESRGLETWRKARQARDWKRFAPALRHMVELKREVAKRSAAAARRERGAPRGAARGRAAKPSLYDELLDDYEPGATVAALDPLFARLRAFCGEAEVTPIHPFKLEQRVSESDAIYEGLYVFDPGALGPHCGAVKLVLYSEKEPEKGDTRLVDPKVLQRIWQDFAVWRTS